MHTIATCKMTPEARVVLEAAQDFSRKNALQFFRPRDIGGTAKNRYASHLTLLITRGFIERREARPSEWRDTKLFEYRITEAGIQELAQ